MELNNWWCHWKLYSLVHFFLENAIFVEPLIYFELRSLGINCWISKENPESQPKFKGCIFLLWKLSIVKLSWLASNYIRKEHFFWHLLPLQFILLAWNFGRLFSLDGACELYRRNRYLNSKLKWKWIQKFVTVPR